MTKYEDWEQFAEAISRETFKDLADVQREDYEIKHLKKSTPRLIYPLYASNKKRTSEQEARFIFCKNIEDSDERIFYSVETPTKLKYRFSPAESIEDLTVFNDGCNGEGQSAMIDTTLYKRFKGRVHRRMNVEFKAHNPGEKNIAKDFLKLLAEEENGIFFHVLHQANFNT